MKRLDNFLQKRGFIKLTGQHRKPTWIRDNRSDWNISGARRAQRQQDGRVFSESHQNLREREITILYKPFRELKNEENSQV